jgi:hypothetical protein
MPLVMDSPPSKPFVPPHLNNRYINSYFITTGPGRTGMRAGSPVYVSLVPIAPKETLTVNCSVFIPVLSFVELFSVLLKVLTEKL